MVRVQVRQQDRGWPCSPRTASSAGFYQLAPVRPCGVDQDPRRARSHEVDVGFPGPFRHPVHPGRDFRRPESSPYRSASDSLHEALRRWPAPPAGAKALICALARTRAWPSAAADVELLLVSAAQAVRAPGQTTPRRAGGQQRAPEAAGWPKMRDGDVQPPAPPVLPAGASPCPAVLPEMVRLPPGARVTSIRRAFVLGDAGMVTCRTPSA